LFGQLPLGDVDGRAYVTNKRTVRVVSRHARTHHPAIFAVVAPESLFHLKPLVLLGGLHVPIAASLDFVGVWDLHPAISQRRSQWESCEIEVGFVDVRDVSLDIGYRDHDRSGI